MIIFSINYIQSDEGIFNNVKNDLQLESSYIDVIYNKDQVLRYVLDILLDATHQKMEVSF